MQFQIIKLMMSMVEQQWEAPFACRPRNDSFKNMYGAINAREPVFPQSLSSLESMDYGHLLCLVWHVLNKLKGFY